MFKEMPRNVADIKLETTPVITTKSVIMKFLPSQDTTNLNKPPQQNSVNEVRENQITITSANSVSSKKSDLILTKSVSIQQVNEQSLQPSSLQTEIDTSSSRVFQHDGYSINSTKTASGSNFLFSISQKNISNHYNEIIIKNNSSDSLSKKQLVSIAQPQTIKKETGYYGTPKVEASLNWLPAILLISLFTFSWVKLIYQKYVVQVVTSIVNYQVSIRLLREKNVLFRNMAIGLNVVFAVNLGLLIYYYLQFNNLNQLYSSNLLSVIVYSISIVMLYNIKTFLCKIIGSVFLVKDQFSEYVHNIHLYNKNLGLFLFPIIIIFPYITDIHAKAFVLYLGLIIVIAVFLLLIYRGIQIIMRNGVSICLFDFISLCD
jgi:hypothetical protein